MFPEATLEIRGVLFRTGIFNLSWSTGVFASEIKPPVYPQMDANMLAKVRGFKLSGKRFVTTPTFVSLLPPAECDN